MTEFERVACEAASRAGAVLRRRFRETDPLKVESKGLHDFVTEVDREAEQAAVGWVRERFPDHVVMSEEGSPDAGAGEYRWVIDPLDGTTNFIHGVTPFSVSVALEDREGPIAAAILDPIHQELFRASRGGGAFCNDKPIRVSDPDGPDLALFATGFPFRELSRLDCYMKSFEAFVRTTAGIRRAGSAAIDLARTASGRYDGFWEIGLSRWDIAAGVLLVREAGGVVTDPLGTRTELDSGDIVAAGPRIHEFMLGVTRKAFGAC
jgi:myo-inositol-1(or 4)-monophosphatase